jgi:cytidylate kinase
MIRITINGPIASGKSTVGRIIAATLKAEGWDVEHIEGKATTRPRNVYRSVQIEETTGVHE